ncbi:MAG: DUF440 family protein, partial [Candidatus Schmidhempelia sp.]|nr:DUF440 family protein [Candidatus Schmidhempelia sp.]
YDIFLELASDNLDSADIILFNLQFEDIGAAELYTPDPQIWQQHEPDININNLELYAEVLIGLIDNSDYINNIFARVLLSRDKAKKLCHIIWKE